MSCWQALYLRARSIRGRGLFLSASRLLNLSANIEVIGSAELDEGRSQEAMDNFFA